MRVGIGYDVHKLVNNRKLIVGGVDIPFEKGLLGHSDADVLIHAIIDSLLGAAGKGDIGKMFPDTDDTYKGISSLALLEKVWFLLRQDGFHIQNIDSVIIAQRPKFSPHTNEMATNIAKCLGVSKDLINVKAKTEEGLGFTGSGEGIAAKAVCCIEKTKNVQLL